MNLHEAHPRAARSANAPSNFACQPPRSPGERRLTAAARGSLADALGIGSVSPNHLQLGAACAPTEGPSKSSLASAGLRFGAVASAASVRAPAPIAAPRSPSEASDTLGPTGFSSSLWSKDLAARQPLRNAVCFMKPNW